MSPNIIKLHKKLEAIAFRLSAPSGLRDWRIAVKLAKQIVFNPGIMGEVKELADGIKASDGMKKMAYTYSIECAHAGKWHAFIKEKSRTYCSGYMDAMRGQVPRRQLRLVRSDGKVIDKIDAHDDVGVGQVAGFPTAEQYEQAGRRALERAAEIRNANNTRRESREA